MRCLALLVCAGHAFLAADVSGYPDYLSAIESLDESGREIARSEGKQALLDRYRDLLAAYPGYARNIKIEMRMIEILEWDIPETGEKPDPRSALDASLRLIEAYEPDHPLMKTAKQQAAQRAEPFDPEVAERLYTDMIQQYGEDDLLQLQCHCRLGRLAADQGRFVDADRFYGDVLGYSIEHMAPGSADFAVADGLQLTAAAGLIMMAVDLDDTPEERLAALNEVLARYPAIAQQFPALVQRFREAIQGQPSTPPVNTYSPMVEALLAQLRTSGPETAPQVPVQERPAAGERGQGPETRKEDGGTKDIDTRQAQQRRLLWPWVLGAAVAAVGIGVLFAGKRRRTP